MESRFTKNDSLHIAESKQLAVGREDDRGYR